MLERADRFYSLATDEAPIMIPMDLQTTWPWMRVFLSLAALFLANSSLLAVTTRSQASVEANRGDLGGDMTILAHFHIPPPSPEESNHYIDMWSGGEVANFARSHGLTNNRALFVVSHARGLRTKGRLRYALASRVAIAALVAEASLAATGPISA